MTRLSIIIPCYNNGEYLKLMLDCFLRQTVGYWEIIIVDDQSTDNTPDVIREYEQKDDRIHFYVRDRQPKGSVVCRNIGFDHSVGEYICHLDADDLVSDTFVAHRVRFMDENPDVDYASFCAKAFTKDKKLPTYETKAVTYGVGINTGDLLEDFLSTKYAFSVWNNIYRRSAIEKYPWDERVKIQTDFSFIVPGILRGMKHAFAGLHEVDYYYRYFFNKKKSINMCSNFVSEDKIASTQYLFRNVLEWLKAREDYELRKKQFLRFVILQFERLINGAPHDAVHNYINLISEYYSEEISLRLSRIANKSNKIVSPKIKKAYLEYNLYKNFHYPIYMTQFIHTLGKIILCK